MTSNALLLVAALRNPASTRTLDGSGWTALLAMARAEQLIGTLAHRLSGEAVPDRVAQILSDAQTNADYQRRSALWEANSAARALAGYPGKVVLMKGTAYVAAGLMAGQGRHIGDLDIMVARDDLPQVERLLINKGGWEWVKEDAYDDAYYRDHMHELPPMIHKERDRMIDVHHTILPLTARQTPDAVAMLADARSIAFLKEQQLYVLSPPDMVIHSAAHLFADGDLAGGLRNLWDIHCLLTEFDAADFWSALTVRAKQHQLSEAVRRAVRLSAMLYGTNIPNDLDSWSAQDKWYIRRLTARDGWGRPTCKLIRLIFYIRSHWLRMPPLMLARHLLTKWRKGRA
jgi:hypothetical protein